MHQLEEKIWKIQQNIEEIEDAGPEIEDRENAYSSETEDGTLTEIRRITKITKRKKEKYGHCKRYKHRRQ